MIVEVRGQIAEVRTVTGHIAVGHVFTSAI